MYYRFGSFLAPLSVGIITSKHYLSERNKNGERGTGDNKNGRDERQPSRLEVGAVITVGVLGFWFGVGAALGTKMVNNLEELISR